MLADDGLEHLLVRQAQVAVKTAVKGLGRRELALKRAAQVVARKLAVGAATLRRPARLLDLPYSIEIARVRCVGCGEMQQDARRNACNVFARQR